MILKQLTMVAVLLFKMIPKFFTGKTFAGQDFVCAVFIPQPLRAVRVLFSPMVSGLAVGKRLSGLYLKSQKV